VKVPQVRDLEVTYRSKLIEFLAGNTEALDRLVVEMYARGLSTRDIEDAFQAAGHAGERPRSGRGDNLAFRHELVREAVYPRLQGSLAGACST
jgi:hypothetical protein